MGSTPMYELQYLPLFYDDLLATVNICLKFSITQKLQTN